MSSGMTETENNLTTAVVVLGCIVGILILGLIAACVYFCKKTFPKPERVNNFKVTSHHPPQPINGLHPVLSNLNSNLNSNGTRPYGSGPQDGLQLVNRVNINDGLYPFGGAVTRWQPNQVAISNGLPRNALERSVTNSGFSHPLPSEGRIVLNGTSMNQNIGQPRPNNQIGIRNLEAERIMLNNPTVVYKDRQVITEPPIFIEPVHNNHIWGIYPSLAGY